MRLTREERTPLGELAWLPITQDGLVDAIDTCRIFDDSYNFWDESGDGWAVLDRSMTLDRISDEKALAEFCSWFVQSSSSDIKAYYDKDQVYNVVYHASPGVRDSIGLLLELGPPGIVDHEFYGTTSLNQSIVQRDHDKIKVLLALGADPHHSCFLRRSNRIESPLSLAMYQSWAFCSFRDALLEMNFHVEDIVRRELEQGGPLMDDGWQVETLSALLGFRFELEVERPENTINECSNCGAIIYSKEVVVQPYWQEVLERVKKGTYLESPCSDTWGVQPASSQSRSPITNTDSPTNTTDGNALSQDTALPYDQLNKSDEKPVITEPALSRLAPRREEICCMDCWFHFKETGRPPSPSITEMSSSDGDDSSEDDFSPFLFNT